MRRSGTPRISSTVAAVCVTGGIQPDEEVHRFADQQTRETAAFLFGRGRYDVMEEFWTAPERADGGEVETEFARVIAGRRKIAVEPSGALPDHGHRSSTLR